MKHFVEHHAADNTAKFSKIIFNNLIINVIKFKHPQIVS